MQEGPNTNYNDWHSLHRQENDIDTPWHNFVKEILHPSDVEGKTVMEIGCGRGGFSEYILNRFPSIDQLFACDYSTSALDIAKNRSLNAQKCVWKQEDIQALSFAANTIDTIISCETIEHVPHPRQALTELYRVLKPGGKFILTCPNYFNLFGIWCLYRKIIGKPYTEGGQPYVNYIQLPSIYSKIRVLGFKIEHFHSAELVLPGRIPKTYYSRKVPEAISFFGSRTFYVLRK